MKQLPWTRARLHYATLKGASHTRWDANSLLCNLLYYSNFSLPLETRGCANETRSGWQVKVRVAPCVLWFLHNCYASSPFLTWTRGAPGSQKPVIWWQTRWTLLRAPQPAAIRLTGDSDTESRSQINLHHSLFSFDIKWIACALKKNVSQRIIVISSTEKFHKKDVKAPWKVSSITEHSHQGQGKKMSWIASSKSYGMSPEDVARLTRTTFMVLVSSWKIQYTEK